MATVSWPWEAQAAHFRTSAFPQMVQANGTNYPVPGLAFNDTTQQNAYYYWTATRYGSGNVTVTLLWYAATATTNAVKWGAQMAAITPITDTQDAETKAFATVATTTTTHLGTTAHRVHLTTITITSTDSVAADDKCVLVVSRIAADAADTLVGNAILTDVVLSYSDT